MNDTLKKQYKKVILFHIIYIKYKIYTTLKHAVNEAVV